MKGGVVANVVVPTAGTATYFMHSFMAWPGHDKFFTGSRHHYVRMVGFRDAPGFVTLGGHSEQLHAQRKLFVKIDIEGWEYRVRDDALAGADPNLRARD